MKKVVVIGGGTGTFVVLSGLKKYPLDLTAVVSMADSGGSNKKIRDEFGLLPPSDIRQCLVALNGAGDDDERILRKLFMYRFNKGEGTTGHTFGNLFIAALSDITGDQVEAIKQAGKLLHIKGKVLPVSLTNTNLVAEYEDGRTVFGEHEIDESKFDGKLHIKKLYLKPRAKLYAEAKEAILASDMIVLGPGDLYTSLLANIVVSGMDKVLQRAKAKIVYVVNLMTKKGQTYGFSSLDHVKEMERYVGRKTDMVLVHKGKFPQVILKKYKEEDEFPVIDNLANGSGRKIIRLDLISQKEVKKVSGDVLRRSLIRHDPDKLAKALTSLF